jgi:hypothetical protein
MGGKTIPLKNREFVFNHTSKDATTYESARRAIYLPVVRNNVYDFFEQFDFPDPAVSNGNRSATVVSSQALWMLNADLVHKAARLLASDLLGASGDFFTRVNEAYLRLYGREASAVEIQRAGLFLDRARTVSGLGEDQRWASLCRTLMAANEFIYLQ